MTPVPDTLLACTLHGRRIAFATDAVAGVLPLPRLWRPPGTPAPVLGFATLGQEAVPAIDLGRLLLDETQVPGLDAHLVLVRAVNAGAMLLLVDRAEGIVAVDGTTARAVEDDRSFNGCVQWEVDGPAGLVHVLALDRLLRAEEQVRLAALAAEAGRRDADWNTAEA